MDLPNYYEVLGVPQQASIEQIKARYALILNDLRARLTSGSPSDPTVLDHLRAAVQTLTNPTARLAYDAQLNADGPSSIGQPASAVTPPQPGFWARAWSGEVRAWKLFWFMLVPALALVASFGTMMGNLFLIFLVVALPTVLSSVFIIGALVLPGIAGVLLWRCALNADARMWSFVNRAIAGATVILTVYSIYHGIVLVTAGKSVAAARKEHSVSGRAAYRVGARQGRRSARSPARAQ